MDHNKSYDVFISYNSEDVELVETINSALQARGVATFFDTQAMQVGSNAIDGMENGLSQSKAFAVFVGKNGWGLWHKTELNSAIMRHVETKHYPVIPVLLPGANKNDLPPFLQQIVFIEFDDDIGKFLDKFCEGLPTTQHAGVKSKYQFTTKDQAQFEQLKPNYCKLMSADWRRLRLDGLDAQASDASERQSMSLEQVYIGLLTTTRKQQKDRHDLESDVPVSALQAVSGDASLVVLLGQPGSGKSTFLRYLAYCLLEAQRKGKPVVLEDKLPEWSLGALFPVFLSLPRLVRHLETDTATGSAQTMESLIEAEFEDNPDLQGFGGPLLGYLQQHGGLVLFDGLDEVSSSLRVVVKDCIQRFSQLYDRCHVVCTCRTHSYRGGSAWQLEHAGEYELAAFNPDQITGFIERWYDSLSDFNPSIRTQYETKKSRLIGAMSANDTRQLQTIAGNPLLLTVMAIVHTHYGELPDSRVEVYATCVELLLDRWSVKRTEHTDARSLFDALRDLGIKKAKVYQGLRALAYEGLRTGESKRIGDSSRGLVGETLVEVTLRRYLGQEGTDCFLAHCRADNGLLLAQGLSAVGSGDEDQLETVFSFPHLTFQEYLAACRLCELPENRSERQGLSAELAGETAWREVIRFQMEHLCFDEREARWGDALMLLRRLAPEATPADETDWRRLILAGELAPTVIQEALADDRETIPVQRVQTGLVALLQNPVALGASPIERAAAGRVLSHLGDPRPGVAKIDDTGLPVHAWVPIPGTREMGLKNGLKLGQGAKADPLAEDNEAWPDTEAGVDISAFYMSAYPVTYVQFGCFVAAEDGYSNTVHWTQAGLADRGDQTQPYLWDDPDWHVANHPVVGVTWYEAVAYCNWLTNCWEKLLRERQWTIRLPTEAEWEWAARGPEARCWPWGDDWQGGPCNSSERGLNRTVAVGSDRDNHNWADILGSDSLPNIPTAINDAISSSGVYDLAGNVLEWCASRWVDSYAKESVHGEQWHEDYLKGGDLRVLRGGDYFWGDKMQVRGAARDSGATLGTGTSAGVFGVVRPRFLKKLLSPECCFLNAMNLIQAAMLGTSRCSVVNRRMGERCEATATRFIPISIPR